MTLKLLLALLLSGLVAIGSLLGGVYWSFRAPPAAWSSGAPSPIPRVSAIAAAVEGRLIVFGGFATPELDTPRAVHAYDVAGDRWQRRSDLPFEGLSHANAAVDGHRVWIAGGFVGPRATAPTAAVRVYDARTDRWREDTPLPQPIGGGVLARVERQLHYIGGFTAADQPGAEPVHWVLNLDSAPRRWEERASLPMPRGHAGTAVVDGRIYVVGGSTRHDAAGDCRYLHRYDPVTDRWTRLADLPSARSHFEPGTFVHAGRVFIVGGQDYAARRLAEPEMPDIAVYDPGTDAWRTRPGLPRELRAPVAAVLDGRLVVTTGSELFAERPRPETWLTACNGEARSLCNPDAAFRAADVKGRLRGQFKRLSQRLPYRLQDWLNLAELAGI